MNLPKKALFASLFLLLADQALAFNFFNGSHGRYNYFLKISPAILVGLQMGT